MNFLRKLIRRQVIKTGHQIASETTAHNLERRLNLAALIFLNVSNSIGSGIYVLTGMASNLYAGQFVSVSYFIAGIACLLSAFCFAEFASRIKTCLLYTSDLIILLCFYNLFWSYKARFDNMV